MTNSKRIDPKCLEIATYLVEHGAFLSVHNAASLGDLKHLKKFHRSELLTVCPATGLTVAHIASRDNNVEILHYLKCKAFDFRTPCTQGQLQSSGGGNGGGAGGGPTGPTCLWIACDSSSHEAAIELIHYCPELREIPFKGKTPIKVALENKDFILVKKLKHLQCRADIEVAIALEDDAWIRQHLNDIRNANVKIEQQKLALLYACKYGWEKLVKHLIEECEVDLNDRYTGDEGGGGYGGGGTKKRVVDIVCSQGNLSLMKLLMQYVTNGQKRFNVNEYTTSCPTLLFTAIQSRHWEIVSLILDHQPDLSITQFHRTPLHEILMVDSKYVKDSIRVKIVKKMLENGVNVLAVDSIGCTALHYAASINEDMVMLILKGYIGHKNKDKKDALDVGQEANQELPSLKFS
jgi:ankyrin repeat protein